MDISKKNYLIVLFIILFLISVFSLLSCSSNVTKTIEDSTEATNIISWDEAKNYNGKTVTITGPIVNYFYSEGWEFTSLTIGKTGEGGVSVVIYDQDSEGFPDDMESFYLGKDVSVTSEVSYRENSDVCQININNPDQIKVLK